MKNQYVLEVTTNSGNECFSASLIVWAENVGEAGDKFKALGYPTDEQWVTKL